MTGTTCPSCGTSVRSPRVGPDGSARCPRCGDPLSVAEAATMTVDHRPAAADPSTVDPGTPTVPSADDAPAPSVRLPSVPGYELLDVIGRGGMGVVYRARQLSPRRVVALKLVLAGRADRFRAEVAAVARLQHPNVVRIHEVGDLDGRPFFSMEYVAGGSLAARLKDGPLPPKAAAALVSRLARAAQHAHDKGIVHRDLKPANVLLAEGEGGGPEPKIADFGLAKHLEAAAGEAGPMTQSGAILGTPSYMAPEQAKGKVREVGPAVDVYALGAVLYECLGGRPPFREDSHLDTLVRVISDDPVPLRELRPKLPRDLEVVCLKCLRKEPGQRYKSAAALADDLDRFLAGRPIAARSRTPLERAGGWARRHRAPLVVAAGVLFISLVAAVLLAVWPDSTHSPFVTAPPPYSASRLPDDLRLVPPNAFLVASVRVADVWANPVTRDLVDHANRRDKVTLDDLGRELQRHTIVPPDNIDRLTLVNPDASGRTPSIKVIRTVRPYSATEIDAVLGRGMGYDLESASGHPLYIPRGHAGESCLVYSNLVLLIGDPDQLRQMAAVNMHPDGPLTPALEQAAGSHTLVVGLNPPPEVVADAIGREPRLGREADALAQTRTVAMTVDVGPPDGPARTVAVDVHGWVTFPSDDAAWAARPHLPGVVRVLADKLFADQPFLPSDYLAGLVEPVLAAVWDRFGDTLRAYARVEFDTETAKERMDEMVVRRAARQKLDRIARALNSYHERHGRLPPAVVTDAAGQPLYSWRVLVLPYLGGEVQYRRFHLNRAWDHPSNRSLLDQMPDVFAAPGAGRGGGTTPYQVPAGKGGLFDDPEGRTFGEVTDGTANTLLVVEAADEVPWTKPADAAFDHGEKPRLGGLVPPGFHAATADGRVRFIPHKAATTELVRGLFTRAGGETLEFP